MKLLILLLALALGACAQEAPPPITIDRGCKVFEPYTRSRSHVDTLDKGDRVFIARHNAAGKSYCKWKGV